MSHLLTPMHPGPNVQLPMCVLSDCECFLHRPAVSYQSLPALADDVEGQEQRRGWGVCLEPHVLIPVLISTSDMIGSLASGVRSWLRSGCLGLLCCQCFAIRSDNA